MVVQQLTLLINHMWRAENHAWSNSSIITGKCMNCTKMWLNYEGRTALIFCSKGVEINNKHAQGDLHAQNIPSSYFMASYIIEIHAAEPELFTRSLPPSFILVEVQLKHRENLLKVCSWNIQLAKLPLVASSPGHQVLTTCIVLQMIKNWSWGRPGNSVDLV